ncbi:hypothetical protein K505DRAFT_255096 [Melanomma pulvis-pyrius CBS 109.77]|uniref:Uncharacterized protein n=1 Tax=Melanomma pulvis-pyrius CBS 109.77 TaxID=1314802 RepID=A0A6A6WXH6_9PLEO|nr:hypothetical protein K505DRAFT_255096 [Melanomma pulvis-pyrius CBS 109.77]
MGLLSILPATFSAVETWLTRVFLLIAILIIGPWAAILLYDLLLYVVRSIGHEIPVVGGRARGKARPRAPSLAERPSGHRRNFSIARRNEHSAQTTTGLRSESPDPRWGGAISRTRPARTRQVLDPKRGDLHSMADSKRNTPEAQEATYQCDG